MMYKRGFMGVICALLMTFAMVSGGYAQVRNTTDTSEKSPVAIYVGPLDDLRKLSSTDLQAITQVDTIEELEAKVAKASESVQVIYISQTAMKSKDVSALERFYDAGIALIAINTPMSVLTDLTSIKPTVDDLVVPADPASEQNYVVISMVFSRQDGDGNSHYGQITNYFASFAEVPSVVNTLLNPGDAGEANAPQTIQAVSGSWADGYGGWLNGSSYTANEGIYIYAYAFTSRTPSSAYYNYARARGFTNCGGGWHPIGDVTATKTYGSVQAKALTGSTQCPDPPAGGLKSQAVGTHQIQTYPGSNWTYGNTEMIR